MKPSIKRVCLDMDDVLNNFTMHALSYVTELDLAPDDWSKYSPWWGFDIVRAANELLGWPWDFAGGYTQEEFWTRVTEKVWESAPVSKLCSKLIHMCFYYFDPSQVCILTAPRPEAGCIEGKKTWVKKHMPKSLQRNVIYTEVKHLLACQNSLLIDDSDKNVDRFRLHGGRAILVPRPWNSNHMVRDYDEYVLAKLESYI